MIKKLSSSVHSLLKVTKNYSTSKLFIPYNETSNTYVVIEPYVNFENNFKNIKTLKDNIAFRGLNINVDKICDNWSNYENARDELVSLNSEKLKLVDELKTKGNTDISLLKEKRSIVMSRLKTLRDHISTLEKEVVIPSLSLPNSLHPDCPLSEVEILCCHNVKQNYSNKGGLSHLEIGAALDCLEYTNAVIIYLKNELALCEQAILSYFSNSLDQLDFITFCNSDLIKSVIIEGCGSDFNNPDQTFILSDKNVHLVGGASLPTFCAFLAKQSVGENKLPLNLYAAGRSYKPTNNNNTGLFSAVQTNAVQFLIGSIDEQHAKEQFDKMLAVYKQLYTDIGLQYRIVYSPACMLENWESLKVQVELYSVNSQNYIEVASLSLSGDFISKRLRIHCSGKNKKQEFLHIVSGKIVDTNVLLGCILEQNAKELSIPDCLKYHMII